jgi:hypothetical protein
MSAIYLSGPNQTEAVREKVNTASIHIQHIPSRPVSAPSGGLCGLASLYLALSNTLLSQSQLTLYTYSGMRDLIGQEMLLNDSTLATLTDVQLLDNYFSCK